MCRCDSEPWKREDLGDPNRSNCSAELASLRRSKDPGQRYREKCACSDRRDGENDLESLGGASPLAIPSTHARARLRCGGVNRPVAGLCASMSLSTATR